MSQGPASPPPLEVLGPPLPDPLLPEPPLEVLAELLLPDPLPELLVSSPLDPTLPELPELAPPSSWSGYVM
jgi:hypothetical protein